MERLKEWLKPTSHVLGASWYYSMERLKEWLKRVEDKRAGMMNYSMERLKEWLKQTIARYIIAIIIAWKGLKSG